jgi:branched-chain amino acid transport system ATP-binding protein
VLCVAPCVETAAGGADVTRLAQHARCRRGIGRAHQIPRPFGGMTVMENVLVGATAGAAARAAGVRALH